MLHASLGRLNTILLCVCVRVCVCMIFSWRLSVKTLWACICISSIWLAHFLYLFLFHLIYLFRRFVTKRNFRLNKKNNIFVILSKLTMTMMMMICEPSIVLLLTKIIGKYFHSVLYKRMLIAKLCNANLLQHIWHLIEEAINNLMFLLVALKKKKINLCLKYDWRFNSLAINEFYMFLHACAQFIHNILSCY